MSANLPHDLEAERSVLGAILVHPEHLAAVLSVIAANDFYRKAHEQIFAKMIELDARRAVIDFVTLRGALADSGELDDVGGPAYLTSLAHGMPREANVKYHAAIIREKSLLRALRAAGQKAVSACDEYDAEFSAIARAIGEDLYTLSAERERSDWVTGKELAHKMYQHVEELIQHRGIVRGRASGFTDLDVMTGGFLPGEMTVLGAQTGVGKTMLALQIAAHVAKTDPVAFVSLEMGHESLGFRIIVMDVSVDSDRLKAGLVSEREQLAIAHSIRSLEASALNVDDGAANTRRSPHPAAAATNSREMRGSAVCWMG